MADLVNINEKKGFPRTYRHNVFIRTFATLTGFFCVFYAFWYIFNQIDAETPGFKKAVPFIILFFGINSLLRNLFGLNSVKILKKGVKFCYILRKSVFIEWDKIKSIKFKDGKIKNFLITYDKSGIEKVFELSINFPNMLEIINSVAQMRPDAEYDEFLNNVVVWDKEEAAEIKSDGE